MIKTNLRTNSTAETRANSETRVKMKSLGNSSRGGMRAKMDHRIERAFRHTRLENLPSGLEDPDEMADENAADTIVEATKEEIVDAVVEAAEDAADVMDESCVEDADLIAPDGIPVVDPPVGGVDCEPCKVSYDPQEEEIHEVQLPPVVQKTVYPCKNKGRGTNLPGSGQE